MSCNLSDALCRLNETGQHHERLVSEYIEIGILTACFFVGGPLNLYALHNSLKTYRACPIAPRLLVLKLNLNIADLIIIFGYALSEIIWLAIYQWHGGDLLCRAVKFIHVFGFYLTSNVVVCIAIDRAYTTLHMRQLNLKLWRNVGFFVRGAWIAAVLSSLPQLFIFTVIHLGDYKQCISAWPLFMMVHAPGSAAISRLQALQHLYSWFHLVAMFWLPGLIVMACYVFIISRLNYDIRKGLLGGAPDQSPGSSTANYLDSLTDLPLLVAGVARSPNGRCMSPTSTTQTCVSSTSTSDPARNRAQSMNVGGVAGGATPHRDHLVLPEIRERAASDSKSKMPQATEARAAIFSRHANRRNLTKAPRSSAGSLASAAAMVMAESCGARPVRRRTRVASLTVSTLMRAQNKTLRKAALILLAYMVCYSPYNVLAVYSVVDSRMDFGGTVGFLNSLLVINAIVNPLIYGVTL